MPKKTEFEEFFREEWPKRLEEAEVPREEMARGEGEVSWDRRAAWLLWVAEGRAK